MEKVIFSEHRLNGNGILGHVSLNRPEVLNVLDVEMLRSIKVCLDDWQNREEVKAVFLDGSGERAFCAGGDIKKLYLHAKAGEEEKVEEFFKVEYSLDYAIHQFTKPMIVWGDGILMGGGIGLFVGASHRIVTERTVMAMPEVLIGLFPDVGASYFLNKMPFGLGRLLGVTGACFSASDGVFLGIADTLVDSACRELLWKTLLSQEDWKWASPEVVVDQVLGSFKKAVNQRDSEMFTCLEVLKPLCQAGSYSDFLNQLGQQGLSSQSSSESSSEWLERAKKRFFSSSPLSACVAWEQLQRSQNFSLEEAFLSETILVNRLVQRGEFQEGVRALLIDKDYSPRWRHSSFKSTPDNDDLGFFLSEG